MHGRPRYVRGVSRVVLLAVVAACSGGYGPDGPRPPDTLRLVECAPAQPLFVEVDGRVTTHSRLDGEGMGWAGSGATKRPKRVPSVSFSMPSSSGLIDLNVVGRIVRAKSGDLERCFERELAANPTMTQRVTAWRYSITQDGRVMFASPLVQSMLATTNECVIRVLRSMTFPARQTGGTAMVTQTFTVDMIPVSVRPVPLPVDKVAWTPYAVGAFAVERAAPVARAAESMLRGKREKLEACFAKQKALGSLRAVLGVQGDGNVAQVRAGGIGDGVIEACVEKELVGTKVVNPPGMTTEVTCDFARGDAQQWRITPSDGYGVIAVNRKEMRFGDTSVAMGALEPDALPANKTYLIVTEPDAPGSILTSALAWAAEGDASLVALHDGKQAPMYLGMARVGPDDQLSSRPILILGRKNVQACLGKQTREGKISEAGQLALKLAARCKTMRCGSLVVGIDDLALARDLVEVTGAARRAGFERVVIGGRVTCEKSDDEDDDS